MKVKDSSLFPFKIKMYLKVKKSNPLPFADQGRALPLRSSGRLAIESLRSSKTS
jgi:hypothetical protein